MTDYTRLIERLYNSHDAETLCADAALAIEALQTEVERLDKENTDSLVSLATAIQHRDGFRKQLDYLRHEMDDLEEDYSNLQAERDALAAKLAGLKAQEPVAYLFFDIQSGDIEVSVYEDEKPRSHWQHQFTEVQAENERLKRELEISKLDTKEWHSQADALQSKLDAMGKGEPVAHVYAIERTGRPLVAWDDARGIGLGDKLYAAPKALAPEPLTPYELQQVVELLDEEGHDGKDFEPECPLCTARQKLAAHGIGGTP